MTAVEKEAVGAALSNALGVLSGKEKSGDKFTICSNLFPDGAPRDANDASWQACKDELPSQHSFNSLLSWQRAVLARGGAKQPLTAVEREAVGAALNNALTCTEEQWMLASALLFMNAFSRSEFFDEPMF